MSVDISFKDKALNSLSEAKSSLRAGIVLSENYSRASYSDISKQFFADKIRRAEEAIKMIDEVIDKVSSME